MTALIVACPGNELLVPILAFFGGACLLLGAMTATVPALWLRRRWPMLLTPLYAVLWETLSILALSSIP